MFEFGKHECWFLTNKGLTHGTVVKNNTYTLWVRLPDGKTIKRHIRKHILPAMKLTLVGI